MKVILITYIYPNNRFPEWGSFIENHVREWISMGVNVDVIAPKSVTKTLMMFFKKKHQFEIAGNIIDRPWFLSFSSIKIGSFSFSKLTSKSISKAFNRALKRSNTPDIYIGKFLFPGGEVAVKAGLMNGRKAYADLGESDSFTELNYRDFEEAQKIMQSLHGVFCVSPRLVNEAIKLGVNSDNILYAPNTVNTNLFRPLNKGICRNKLNLPNDIFIVVFVGHFIERKGPLRVLEAIDSLNIPVKGVFLGQGSQEPKGQNVIFSGSVQNRELPEWLNASDVFVLPTLAEGNCNAINEAMACGLPVISSNISDIKYQVPEDAGILVDPNDPKLIADAILKLYTNKQMLQTFRNNCILYSKERNIKSRAKQIMDWVIEKELR